MKRFYITFSGQAWNDTTRKIVEDAPRFGADEVLVYDDKWLLTTGFYEQNQWLWHHPDPHGVPQRGFGWFSWKPFIVLHAMDHFLRDGDVVLYTDADTHPIADLRPLYDYAAEHEALLFKAQGCSVRQWVKRDCLEILGMTDPRWLERDHAVARFMFFKKGGWPIEQFLCEWLTYCLNQRATTFDRSVFAPEHEGFQEHRTEQAIFGMLALRYGYPLHREACQFGNAALEQFREDEWYPQTFVQEWGSGPRDVGPGSAYRNVEARLAQLRNASV
jgi:hypothetical protein